MFTCEALKLVAGYEELPLIHFMGVMFKGYEIHQILDENSEIDVFQRNIELTRVDLFEYIANNNYDNHRKWVILKHQQNKMK